jgi:hypothetical protein
MAGSPLIAGALNADGVSFTSSEDRTVFSFIYDKFVAEWAGSETGGDDMITADRHVAFALLDTMEGARLAVELFGARYGALQPSGKVSVQIAERAFEIPLEPSDEAVDIEGHFEIDVAGKEIVNLHIAIAFPKPEPPGQQAMVVVESFSVTMLPPAEGASGSYGASRSNGVPPTL